jgi:hypothetical protein
LTVNHLPDEMLLEIFDSYRRDIYFYDLEWRKEHAWINLAHVCRKWRAVTFASCSRLDLGVTVGPEKPGHIKSILSGTLPISINYRGMYGITRSALWRMRAVLEHHHDRVREIAFEGMLVDATNFNKILKVTQYAFPMLEGLILHFDDYYYEPKLPDTFLRGPDLLDLHLRRLELKRVSLDAISGFLFSATALTDLSLSIDTAFGPPKASLLTCLQGMPCLRHLNLSIDSEPPLLPPTTPNPKKIVSLSKLTGFRYDGGGVFFDTLAARLSAPSLRDFYIRFLNGIPPIVHLPRFINEIEEQYYAVHVKFFDWFFCLSLQTQSEYISRCEPRFELPQVRGKLPGSIIRMGGVLFRKLATVEELRVTFQDIQVFPDTWENSIPWRELLQHFPRLKAFRTKGALNHRRIARALYRDHGEPNNDLAFLSALEEIELGKISSLSNEYERGHELAAFEPIVSARQQAGCPIKVFFSP